jgi:hypothetical protein
MRWSLVLLTAAIVACWTSTEAASDGFARHYRGKRVAHHVCLPRCGQYSCVLACRMECTSTETCYSLDLQRGPYHRSALFGAFR